MPRSKIDSEQLALRETSPMGKFWCNCPLWVSVHTPSELLRHQADPVQHLMHSANPPESRSEAGWKQRGWGNIAFHLEGCSCLVSSKGAVSSEWQHSPRKPLYSLFCLTSKLGGNKNSQRIVPRAHRPRTQVQSNTAQYYSPLPSSPFSL